MNKHIDTQTSKVRVRVTTEDARIRPRHACLIEVGNQAPFALTRREALDVVTMLVQALHERAR